jgi:putative glutamine amidotransferase
MARTAVGLTIGNSGDDEIFHLRDDYVRAVEAAGALPLVLAPGRPEDAAEILDRVDAVVLSGGADVDPALYGAARHPAVAKSWARTGSR